MQSTRKSREGARPKKKWLGHSKNAASAPYTEARDGRVREGATVALDVLCFRDALVLPARAREVRPGRKGCGMTRIILAGRAH